MSSAAAVHNSKSFSLYITCTMSLTPMPDSFGTNPFMQIAHSSNRFGDAQDVDETHTKRILWPDGVHTTSRGDNG